MKKPDKKDKEPKTIDRQACSHAFRDFYICLVQEIAGNGKCKDGAKLLELPEGTICLDDLKTDDIYQDLVNSLKNAPFKFKHK